MRLEDEIKQTKPFASEVQKLVLNITVTSSWLATMLSDLLKPFGITPHQYNVLRILKGKYPDSHSNQDITRRMIDKSSNATRIVDKLVQKEFASRTEDTHDRRLVNIKITKKGLKLLEAIHKKPFLEQSNLSSISLEKAKLMNKMLDEMRG